jgi:hypothetical protein
MEEHVTFPKLDGPSLKIFPFTQGEEEEEPTGETVTEPSTIPIRDEETSKGREAGDGNGNVTLSGRRSERRVSLSEANLDRERTAAAAAANPTIANTSLLSLDTCPIYLEESQVARRRLWIHLILLGVTVAFSIVTFFTILQLYYRIPGKGTTCELTQQFTSAGLTPTSLQNVQGIVFCQMPLAVSGVMMTLLVPLMVFPLLMLLRIIAYYQYSLGWAIFLLTLMTLLWLVQLAMAIVLVIGYVETCNVPTCARSDWSHAAVALVGTIFAWLTLLPLVSHREKGRRGSKKLPIISSCSAPSLSTF